MEAWHRTHPHTPALRADGALPSRLSFGLSGCGLAPVVVFLVPGHEFVAVQQAMRELVPPQATLS